jgi:hypothetical protein
MSIKALNMKTKKSPIKSKSKVSKAKPAKKAKKRVVAAKKPAPRTAALKPRPPLVARKSARRPGTKRNLVHKPSSFSSMQVFWSAGILGGVLVVSSALWSAWQTPAIEAPPVSQASVPAKEGPLGAHPIAATQTPVAGVHSDEDSVHPSKDLQAAFDEASKLPSVGDRMAWWTRWIAKDKAFAQAQLSSLGTGPIVTDPVSLLPAKFDCTTFVETVIALGRSARPQDFFKRVIQVRYLNGTPTYIARNHFPEMDWIPNNIAAGVLSDVTGAVAEKTQIRTQVVSKTIDRAKWIAKQLRDPSVSRAIASERASLDSTSPRKVSLTYLPRKALVSAVDSVPNGTVINFVRGNSASRPVLITHQGIVVRDGGSVLLRHVSPGGILRTVALGDYLKKNPEYIGVTLNRVND